MTTWVLLRGLTREARHWGDFAGVLSEAFDADEVVALDLPGCGTRYGERSPTNISAIMEAARSDLAARGIRPPYVLIGLSLGGMVAVDWAVRQRKELLGAVLINTSLRGFGTWGERLRPRSYVPLLAALFGGRDEAVERTILRLTSRQSPSIRHTLLDDWLRWRRDRPVSRANAVRQLVAAARYRPPAAPSVPLLVLASSNDALVDPVCSRQIAEAWRADVACHPTAGHDLPLDDAEWFASQVVAWFGRVAPADRH